MTNGQFNRLNMYRAVREVLNSHQNAWSGVPAFADAYNVFSERLTLLIQHGQKQKMIRSGITTAKKVVVNKSVDMAYVIAGALKVYAVNIEDPVLKAKVTWTRTDLKKGKMEDVLGRLKELQELFVTHLDALADYGIEASDLDNYAALLADHESKLLTPLHAKNEGKLITDEIARLFVTLNDDLELRINPLVHVLKNDHPEFAAKYFKAREIVDLGIHHQQKAADPATGEDGVDDNPERDDGSGQ